jgi:cyclase
VRTCWPPAHGRIGFFRTVQDGLPAADALRYPALTFERRLTLNGPARRVELITFGGGHSPCDTVLWLPEERILFAADLMMVGGQPALQYGNPEAWLRILDEIDQLGAAIIVPGHGPVQAPADTAPVRQYITDLLDLAAKVAHDGTTPERAGEVEMPAAYRALPLAQTFTLNLAFLLRRMG